MTGCGVDIRPTMFVWGRCWESGHGRIAVSVTIHALELKSGPPAKPQVSAQRSP